MGNGESNEAGEVVTEPLGPPDPTAMRVIRNLFLEEEPLVAAAEFDDVLNPQTLHISSEDGLDGADACRFDVTWYRSDAYRFHYVDTQGTSWRFDRHPNPHSPEKHFHEPPDAPTNSAVESCIEIEEPELVGRAVLKLWRRAYDRGDVTHLNTAADPP